jgi:hypothetical protein
VGISPVKTHLLAIAEIALRKSVLPYSCFPLILRKTQNKEKKFFSFFPVFSVHSEIEDENKIKKSVFGMQVFEN